MTRPRKQSRLVIRPGFGVIPLLLLAGPGILAQDLPGRTALDDYVARDDGAFSWKLLKTVPGQGFTGYLLDMTSQRWRRESEVDRTLWQHWVTIIKPQSDPGGELSRTALLYVGGGANGGDPPRSPARELIGTAVATGAVVVELRMVPNQPLRFAGDSRGRKEDDLVAHTWNKYMETGDATWVARMPMVKSAVRAMDATQAFLRSEDGGKMEIDRFVVAGGSKRGWTTWLTGAVDKRVVAVIPIVIDVLNVIPSMEHHYAAYGFWAPAIGDYERNRITDKRGEKVYERLIRLVDPYFYRHRLKMPKFLINSTGDQFFLPDSSQFYFDDLVGEKYLRYVPNTDHSLRGSDAPFSLQAYFQAVASGKPRPKFSWRFEDDGSIRVKNQTKPREVRLWQATNPEARDFRLVTIGKAWKSEVLTDGGEGQYVATVPRPEKGWTAFLVELTYDIGCANPLKLTTPVRVVPETLPFKDKLDEQAKKKKQGTKK